jgi:hypothetical protein
LENNGILIIINKYKRRIIMSNEEKVWELTVKKLDMIEELKGYENPPANVVEKYLTEIQAVEDERRLLN